MSKSFKERETIAKEKRKIADRELRLIAEERKRFYEKDREGKQAFLPLTIEQNRILDENVNMNGFGEGVVRTYKRLQAKYGEQEHPAVDDNGEIAKLKSGESYELKNNPQIVNGEYEYNNKIYKKLTRERVIEGKKQIVNRKLLPPRKAIEDFFQKSENVQLHRSTRNKVAGGKRNPQKDALKPVLPLRAKPLDLVFCDSMRLPECQHILSKEDNEFKLTELAGGKKVETYKWAFVIVDCLTKVIWIKPIHQQTELSTTLKKKTKNPLRNDFSSEFIDEDYDPAERPQSDQTFKILKEFIKNINDVRKNYAIRNEKPIPEELHIRLLVHDNGSEFKGVFSSEMEKLRKKHALKKLSNGQISEDEASDGEGKKPSSEKKTRARFYNETVTPNSRSHYNSLAERAVQTMRRYFYAIHMAYKRRQKEIIVPTANTRLTTRDIGVPVGWHVQNQNLKNYDWVIDTPEVMRRYNSSYCTPIKAKPIDALLERGVTYEELYKRLFQRAYNPDTGIYRDVEHNLRLPGFSPSKLPSLGDFVRLKTYKSGDMNMSWPAPNQRLKQSLKSAALNWSKAIYEITKVERFKNGAFSYKITNIEFPGDLKKSPKSLLDRTQILLVHPETKIIIEQDGKERTIKEAARLYKENLEKQNQETDSEEEEEEESEDSDEEKDKIIDYRPKPKNKRGKSKSRYFVGDILEFKKSYFEFNFSDESDESDTESEDDNRDLIEVGKYMEKQNLEVIEGKILDVRNTKTKRGNIRKNHYLIEFSVGKTKRSTKQVALAFFDEGEGIEENEKEIRFLREEAPKSPKKKKSLEKTKSKIPIKADIRFPAISNMSEQDAKNILRNKSRKITFIKNNPKRSSSKSYDRFQIYMKAKTIEEYLELNPGDFSFKDLANDATKGYLKLD